MSVKLVFLYIIIQRFQGLEFTMQKYMNLKKILIGSLSFIAASFSLFPLCAFAGQYHRPDSDAQAPLDNSFNSKPYTPKRSIQTYAYDYVFRMPVDGNWRWIEERCYEANNRNVCIEGHWVRRIRGHCEQVSQHSIKNGNYTRIIPAGPAESCRE